LDSLVELRPTRKMGLRAKGNPVGKLAQSKPVADLGGLP
jgi:hypothetical protein